MLSICIPVYNFDVRKLVNDLHLQATEDMPDFEILLVDDHSDETYRRQNRELKVLEKIEYTELEKNIGRSKIRNLLARKVQFENILFLDCDVEIVGNDFLLKYYEQIQKGEKVVCGGHIYQENPPEKEKFLHWYYGTNREVKTATERQKAPNDSFMTGNFLISRKLFEKIRFDERITGYGHEDTMLGCELDKHGVVTRHIDNPVLHSGLDTNKQFLEKTRQSIHNLLHLDQISDKDKTVHFKIKVLKAFHTTDKLALHGIISKLFSAFRKTMENNLMGSRPSLFMLDLYKLGYLCRIKSC